MAKFTPIQITSSSRGGQDVQRLLDRLNSAIGGQALADFLSKEVYPYLRERALGRFDTAGDDASGKWPALHDATRSWRADAINKGLTAAGVTESGPINVRTGELENYIRGATPALVIDGSSATMIYPGNLPDEKALGQKYRTAQLGKKTYPRTAPRPVIAINSADWTYIYSALEKHIMAKELG